MDSRAIVGLSPLRVIQVVGTLDRWSVETWLLRMLAHARKTGAPADWTFYCSFGTPGTRDEEARALGARVIHSPVPIGRKLAFVAALRAELARGAYDVMDSHHDLISGVYLAASVGLPIRRRIVHVHNPDESVLTPSRAKQAVLKPILRQACLTFADRIVANSNHSLDVFLAGGPRRPGRDLVQYLGVDPTPFSGLKADRVGFRRGLGISDQAPILLFANRVTPEKNPVFAVDVLAALRQRMPDVVGVFAGDGSLEDDVRARARALNQQDSIRMLGWRNDAPQIMACCDWFILPHPERPMEGFGLAVVEAQLAGLRLLLSHGVGEDPLLPGAAVRRLALADPPSDWAQAAIDLWTEPAPSSRDMLKAFAASGMAMDRALAGLIGLYG